MLLIASVTRHELSLWHLNEAALWHLCNLMGYYNFFFSAKAQLEEEGNRECDTQGERDRVKGKNCVSSLTHNTSSSAMVGPLVKGTEPNLSDAEIDLTKLN